MATATHTKESTMSSKHPQGTFARFGNGWAIRVQNGQGTGFGVGSHVTVHLKSGALKQVTLGDKFDERDLGNGKVAYIFDFTDGWTTPAAPSTGLMAPRSGCCDDCGDTDSLAWTGAQTLCGDCQGN
jgi:hypothetical protein